jgi:hypothetical protein
VTATSRATPALLWTRAALMAVVVVAVSTIGHVTADGLLPGPAAFAVLLLLATAVSARFLTHQASTRRILGLLVVGQAVIHGVLSALAGHVGDPVEVSADPGFEFAGRHAERTGSYFDQVAAMQQGTFQKGAPLDAEAPGSSPDSLAMGWLAHQVEHITEQGPVMILGHLAAVVVLGLWLAVGERALWTLLCLVTTTLLAVVARAVGHARGGLVARVLRQVGHRPVAHDAGRDAVPVPWLLRHVVAHRGPPGLLAA